MPFLKSSLLLVLMSLVVTSGAAQVGGTQMPQTGVNAGYNPAALETNNLALGLGFRASYDDNTFNTIPGNGQGLFSMAPRVAWNINRGRWNSVFDYNGLITKSSRFDFYDRSSDTFNTEFNYIASKSLSFTVSDFFVRSVDPLYSSAGITNGGDNTGNPSYFGTPALRTSNGVSANVDYRLDARSAVTVGGDFYISRFSDIPQASLRDNNSAVGRAGYHRAVSPRLTIGSSYDYSKITTGSGFTTLSQRIMATGEYTFTPSMKVSGFIGPNHVTNSFLFNFFGYLFRITTPEWSWSGGGTYTWTTSKMSMSGSAVRQISDGGGLLTTVRMTNFQYRVAGRLPHKLSGSIRAGYTLNDRLVPQTGGFINAHYATAGAEISRAIRRDLTVKLAYERLETQQGVLVRDPWVGRNRVTISIDYLFTHPLGR